MPPKMGEDNSPNFGTFEVSGKSPQRFSMMDTSQTEKNILNINQHQYQPGAVAQAGAQGQNSTQSNKVTLNSAGGQVNEYENMDKENKYKQKFNMRMSKYGQNQFRPSNVINSVSQGGAKLGGNAQTHPRPTGTQESLKAFQSHQNYTDQAIQHQDKGTEGKLVAQTSPFRPKFSSKLENYDSNNASPISFKRDDITQTVAANQQNPNSKRNLINDDFLDKMISQDNAYMQNARASGPTGIIHSKPNIGGGQVNSEFGGGFRGTFYQKQQQMNGNNNSNNPYGM